jgi:hypothetical protein
MIMNNVNATMEGNTLVIKVDCSPEAVSKAPYSKSGKTKLVGSSGGFQKLGNVAFSVNVSSK